MAKRILSFALLATVAVLLASCTQNAPTQSAPQTVQMGDTVAVDYVGSFTNGTVFDSSQGRAPLTLQIGAGQVIPGFENAVLGMQINQSKTVTIPPAQAYGEYNASYITTVPLDQFGQDPTNYTGQYIQVQAPNGQPLRALVVNVTQPTNTTNGTVTLDLNHPLAGKTLVFNITVRSINSTANVSQ